MRGDNRTDPEFLRLKKLPQHTHCRNCKTKLHASASRILGLCRVCAVKSQEKTS